MPVDPAALIGEAFLKKNYPLLAPARVRFPSLFLSLAKALLTSVFICASRFLLTIRPAKGSSELMI
jgi:hypothetical protein